jgi:hypothetical protein
MRRSLVRDRLLLLSAGALVMAALVACGPDAPSTPASNPPPAIEPAPASTPPASTVTVEPSTPAPADALEVPPAMATPDGTDARGGTTPAAAEDTVRRYYAAINARDYATAYALWSNGGAASRQRYEAFAGGYRTTTSVQATVGKASDPEGAAGSRYIQVPIELSSHRSDGSTRHYRGRFTLRAVLADGATPQQRQWHLDSADLEGYEPDAQSKAPATKTP